ncbi:hypothetical protein BGZ51_009108 [Haplosporangium sp. Z 767]|nr:hypothetical protein BGZ51_009108 [Haplosporangium sp. Z 767]KAF9197089.1 hypothetical protein BGZ50_000039 [Haplosporangium sp. Z 11]
MRSIPVTILATLVALVGVAFYRPLQRTTILLKGPHVVENFGMENCQRVSGPSFCDDVKVQRDLGLGFLACDPTVKYRNYAANVFNESRLAESKENGTLWVYDLHKPGSSAEKLVIQGFNGPFHPSGISIAPRVRDATSARTVILAVNHVPFEMPRVEVLYYYHARKNLVYKKTIVSEHFYAAHKIMAISSSSVHQIDDTPSFFVTNDHGFNLTDWRREYEEKYNLPMASLVYYDARADRVQEAVRWLQMPSGLVESYELPGSFWIAQAKGGSLDLYTNNTVVSSEHHGQTMLSVDNGEPIAVVWPRLKNEATLPIGMAIVGIDSDPETRSMVLVSQPKWNAYVQLARERLDQDQDRIGSKDAKTGFVISVVESYDVRYSFSSLELPLKKSGRYSYHNLMVSHDGSEFGTPSGIAHAGVDEKRMSRVLVSGQYEHGFLDCNLRQPNDTLNNSWRYWSPERGTLEWFLHTVKRTFL